ncbi:SMP-30/gluconolactonase/LRE family protein [Fodinibius sediminis]|uniref:Sugar lactone lactonase YvrE n=1 Tax=Fodinibius sediminis TaxID=1214077 RepID=A0A521BIC6_9BACT|nr:SMP-30/gluconolactonase/LRE family protein [Fodinibius sediminis]SMO46884.1 Sugar lactone lactonase YvrE [Fodinibius sediminis]
MQKSIQASLELQWEAVLGEGPVWNEQAARLYWVDILSGTLFCYDPSTSENRTYDIGQHIGCVALRERGGLVMAIRSGFAFFDPAKEELIPVTDPEEGLSGNRFNDGKCDPSGRFWAGTMSYELEEGAGSLYCLDTSLKAKAKLRGITISNGLAWTDHQFFFIDTPTRKVRVFDYDAQSGEIANPSVIRSFGEDEGFPDGMTIDREGKLWIALYGGSRVIRVDPQTGDTLFEVQLPVPKPTCCTFGGAELNELYITTAREHMREEEIEEWPLSGSLFKASVPVRGFAASRFKG